ncbi:glycosyl hydrolase 115 family protein [Niveispirillum fermenti]|uniref:glycosyl hydrolase 115 family protein n=1 Tax=Niveispirillum fermenti TaxID=1233113 RepID=UPI003A89369E
MIQTRAAARRIRLPFLAGMAFAVLAAALPLRPAPALPVTGDCVGPAAVCPVAAAGSMALITGGVALPLLLDGPQDAGVERAADTVRADLARLSGSPVPAGGGTVILAGTLGSSPVIDALAAAGRLETAGVAGRWEAFVVQAVDAPAPGIERALVVAGGDRRGTIFGLYDLIQRAGVSPWNWWADVPVPVRLDLHVTAGARVEAPAVKYRGIFLNDENPALYGWANATFGGFNHAFYDRVFELILRLKGNYLWPAMWGKAFADDDPQNAVLADRVGVVIGTSHHEPMMRAHVEWERHGQGPWNYRTNAGALRTFWRDGIARMGGHESLVTIGMRGDGDEPMEEGTAIDLLQTIVKDQRTILEQVTGRPAAATPQVWALYKEVQDYYDQGMTVPDDVTLLFADDNWGNIRRLPEPGSARPGGYGVYYHFDYVGGPRNYKWLNTNQIERVWEQMDMAHRYGADRIWIVNVGDLKPMEFPTEFFLDMAWSPAALPLERLGDYPRQWAAAQFGPTHARAIGDLLTGYTRLNACRKPELLSPDTFSLIHHDEAARVLAEWEALERQAEKIGNALAPAWRDAYVQLVLHPVLASANLTRLYITVARNRLAADQGRAETDRLAAEAEALFARDRAIRDLYEKETASGKWVHMMSQTHIGYTSWQQPDEDVMPEVRRRPAPARAGLGVMVAGDARGWTGPGASLRLDRFAPLPGWLEIYARGSAPVRYRIDSDAPWLDVDMPAGRLAGDSRRISPRVDWSAVPVGRHSVKISVTGDNEIPIPVTVEIDNPGNPAAGTFVQADGVVAMEAADHTGAVPAGGITWREVPHLGRTRSAIISHPVTAPPSPATGQGARLEYDVHLWQAGEVELRVLLSPTLDFKAQGGLRYAVSIDDEPPQVVNLHTDDSEAAWDRSVADNIRIGTTRHRIDRPGRHVVKLWHVDTGLAFQRLELRTGAVGESYLGPAASRRAP